MSALSNIFISIVCFIVDYVSYAVFKIIAIVAVVLIHMLRIPGMIILEVLRYIFELIPFILEQFIRQVTDLLFTAVFGCVELIQSACSALVGFMVSMIFDILGQLYTALHDFADLFSAFLWNVIKMFGLSLLSIWNNFVDAVAYFIHNV